MEMKYIFLNINGTLNIICYPPTGGNVTILLKCLEYVRILEFRVITIIKNVNNKERSFIQLSNFHFHYPYPYFTAS
jgi:hypothetical protein